MSGKTRVPRKLLLGGLVSAVLAATIGLTTAAPAGAAQSLRP
ncbi:hypothetical protein [Sphaerisporangium perillae]|nr:hypothetical protein [Sphaerisporangium perillae]